jgi:hypothetical protein
MLDWPARNMPTKIWQKPWFLKKRPLTGLQKASKARQLRCVRPATGGLLVRANRKFSWHLKPQCLHPNNIGVGRERIRMPARLNLDNLARCSRNGSSAGFPTCCIADFQIGWTGDVARSAGWEPAIQQTGEVCATLALGAADKEVQRRYPEPGFQLKNAPHINDLQKAPAIQYFSRARCNGRFAVNCTLHCSIGCSTETKRKLMNFRRVIVTTHLARRELVGEKLD